MSLLKSKTGIMVSWRDCRDCVHCKPLAGSRYKCLKSKEKNFLYGLIECPLNAIPLVRTNGGKTK